MSTTDRDPIDSQALGQAVTVWLNAHGDEADIALEAVLVAQGVLTPGESVYLERGSREHGVVHAFIEDCTLCLEVDTEGVVESYGC